MCFEIIDDIMNIETVAVGGRIRDIMRLRKQYGPGRWRKPKGIANVRLQSGKTCHRHFGFQDSHRLQPAMACRWIGFNAISCGLEDSRCFFYSGPLTAAHVTSAQHLCKSPNPLIKHSFLQDLQDYQDYFVLV